MCYTIQNKSSLSDLLGHFDTFSAKPKTLSGLINCIEERFNLTQGTLKTTDTTKTRIK
jgi:hypothetical protein